MEFFRALDDKHRAFIARQPMFFVATAAEGARINLSPKGMDSFRVLGPNRVAYLDLGGSGNETQAHLAADGRITIMFCAFDNPALILRLYGTGRFVIAGEPEFDALAQHFPRLPGARQVFDIAVDSVQTSCGWGVPHMTLDRQISRPARSGGAPRQDRGSHDEHRRPARARAGGVAELRRAVRVTAR